MRKYTKIKNILEQHEFKKNKTVFSCNTFLSVERYVYYYHILLFLLYLLFLLNYVLIPTLQGLFFGNRFFKLIF